MLVSLASHCAHFRWLAPKSITNLQRHVLPPFDGLKTGYVTVLFAVSIISFNTPAAQCRPRMPQSGLQFVWVVHLGGHPSGLFTAVNLTRTRDSSVLSRFQPREIFYSGLRRRILLVCVVSTLVHLPTSLLPLSHPMSANVSHPAFSLFTDLFFQLCRSAPKLVLEWIHGRASRCAWLFPYLFSLLRLRFAWRC